MKTPDFNELAKELKGIINREPGNIIHILERNLTGMFFKGREGFFTEEQVRDALLKQRSSIHAVWGGLDYDKPDFEIRISDDEIIKTLTVKAQSESH